MPCSIARVKLLKAISLPLQDRFAYKLQRLNQSSLRMLQGNISGLISINHSWISAFFFLLNPYTKPHKITQTDVWFQITIAVSMPHLGPVYFTLMFIGAYYQVGVVLPKCSAHTRLNQDPICDGKMNDSRHTRSASWFLFSLHQQMKTTKLLKTRKYSFLKQKHYLS